MTGYMCGYVAITGVIISLHATLVALFISAGSAAVRLLQGRDLEAHMSFCNGACSLFLYISSAMFMCCIENKSYALLINLSM